MAYLLDNFTGAAGALTPHTSDSGQSWTFSGGENPAYGFALSGTGSVYSQGVAGANVDHASSFTPDSADYTITVVFAVKSLVGSMGVWGRFVTPASSPGLTGYLCRYNAGTGKIELYVCVGGGYTLLGSYTYTLLNGDTVALVMAGSSISAKLNGTTRIGPVTSTAVTAAGAVAVVGGDGAGSPTTGIHLDSIAVGSAPVIPESISAVTPAGVLLLAGATQAFAATLANVPGGGSSTPTWSVTGGGTISSAGLYTPPASGTGTATITATSPNTAGLSASTTAVYGCGTSAPVLVDFGGDYGGLATLQARIYDAAGAAVGGANARATTELAYDAQILTGLYQVTVRVPPGEGYRATIAPAGGALGVCLPVRVAS